MTRRAGLTIPLFSIRPAGGRGWGVGEIPDLVPFAAWASRAGFSVIQILPVNEPAGGQNSPYAARTAFALDPVYISLGDVPDFQAAGGLDALPPRLRARLEAARTASSVDWETVRTVKTAALELAYRHFVRHEQETGSARAAELEAFAQAERDWLDDYALFAVLHDEQGSVSWLDWAPPLRYREPVAVDAARVRHAVRIDEKRYIQWQADRQWHAARRAAAEAGVELMGDLPFLVAGDSADIWARAHEFRLDARVGVPPDAFSEEGQDWGLPVFRWDVIAAGDFTWMRERARRAAELFGLFRVDHVVGLYRTFYRPGLQPSAGPGRFTPEREEDQLKLGERVLAILDGRDEGQRGRVIAEDLGVVPDFVRASLNRLEIPGYRVLRWEKDVTVFRDPASWPAVSVATTGTHDTEAVAEWYDALSAEERRAFLELPGLEPLRARSPERFDDEVRDAILACVYASASDLALVPYQDLFGARDRVNVPGTVTAENWTYRMPLDTGALDGHEVTARMRALASETGRLVRP
jgi:4-alpha-glucanotransferase